MFTDLNAPEVGNALHGEAAPDGVNADLSSCVLKAVGPEESETALFLGGASGAEEWVSPDWAVLLRHAPVFIEPTQYVADEDGAFCGGTGRTPRRDDAKRTPSPTLLFL